MKYTICKETKLKINNKKKEKKERNEKEVTQL